MGEKTPDFSDNPYIRRFQEEEAKDPNHPLHGLWEAEKIAKNAMFAQRRKERKGIRAKKKKVKPDGSNHPENNIMTEDEKLEIDSHPAVEEANDIVFKKEDENK